MTNAADDVDDVVVDDDDDDDDGSCSFGIGMHVRCQPSLADCTAVTVQPSPHGEVSHGRCHTVYVTAAG